MTHVIAALDIAEDVILPALRLLGAAWWGVAPVGTVGRLLADASDPAYLARVFVAQHQAAGGPAPLLGSAGWAGPVVVRCMSADDVLARTGRNAAHSALLSLPSPAGYALRARYTGPALIPRDPEGIYTRAAQYEVTIRRAA